MTNQEAIKILDNLKPGDYSNPYEKGEAIVMAISALQAQEAKTQLSAEGTTSDLISRQDAIDVLGVFTQADALGHTPKQIVEALPSAQPEIEERTEEFAQNVPKEDLISRKAAIDAMGKRPMVWTDDDQYALGERNQYDMNRLAIETLPSAQPEPCDDAVSREAAIDAALSAFSRGLLASPDIRRLPSVQPERKTGRWLIREGISDAQCSECKMYFRDVYDMDNSDAFCRHCGAKMEGLKVVEDE